MPNHRTKERWEHATYKYAYVREHRGMACTVIHGSYPLSTGLFWKPSSRARAMAILEERLTMYLHGIEKPRTNAPHTCEDVFRAFLLARQARMTKSAVWEYTRFMREFCPPRTLAASTAKIRDEVLKRVQASDYAHNTKRQGLKRLRAVFEFGIEQGMLSVNPVHRDMIPAEKVAAVQPYSDADIETALTSMQGRSRAFVAFIAATGCRAVEAVRLTWSAVKDDHVIIDGKRSRSDTPALRIIPFALCPEVPEILQEARTAEWTTDRVFGLNNYTNMAERLRQALGDQGRGFHDIRKWRINTWVRKGWPEHVIEAIAGHDTAISKKHYRTPFTAAELARLVQDSDK